MGFEGGSAVAIGRRSAGLFVAALAAFLLLGLGLMVAPAWAKAKLSITKAGPAKVEPGATFKYTLTVKNDGDTSATVKVTDDLPDGVTLNSIEGAGANCAPSSGTNVTVTCNFSLPKEKQKKITLNVKASKIGQIKNNARAEDSTGGSPPDTSNEVTTTVAPLLEIKKADDPDPVTNPEDLLLYTLKVQNVGKSVIQPDTVDIALADELPLDKVDFVTVESSDFDCKETRGTVQCNRTAGLNPGEIVTVEIVVEPEVAGTIKNGAAVFARDLPDGSFVRIDEAVASTTINENAVPGNGNDNDNNNNNNNGNDDINGNDDVNGNEDISIDDNFVSGDQTNTIIDVPNKDLPNTGGGELPEKRTTAILGAGITGVGALYVGFLLWFRRRSS